MKKVRKFLSVALALTLSVGLCACGGTSGGTSSGSDAGTAASSGGSGTIKVGVVNNPPSESGYREANVKDMESVFSAANGYELKTSYSLKNDEQLQAAQGFITEGVDYLLKNFVPTCCLCCRDKEIINTFCDESLSCLKLLIVL